MFNKCVTILTNKEYNNSKYKNMKTYCINAIVYPISSVFVLLYLLNIIIPCFVSNCIFLYVTYVLN